MSSETRLANEAWEALFRAQATTARELTAGRVRLAGRHRDEPEVHVGAQGPVERRLRGSRPAGHEPLVRAGRHRE